jgi:ABC-type lipopolysaccharide export system ATPase subunit
MLCTLDRRDTAIVYITGGSKGSCSSVHLGSFVRRDSGFECIGGLLRDLIDAAIEVASNYENMWLDTEYTGVPLSVTELRRIINMLEGK